MGAKKKIPTLYASNTLVKEVYLLERKIDAMGANISDWRDEYYCDGPRDFLLACIKQGHTDLEKCRKKLERVETKLVKKYGPDVLREIDFIFRWRNFSGLKWAVKRKIRLNNF